MKQEACCYTSDWTIALNATCDTSTGLIAQVRTKAGNCDSSITIQQNASCCQTGEWVSGTCQPDGTLMKTRTVSELCLTTESSAAQESCCYTSDWTNEPNAKCNSATSTIPQVRTKAGNCDASIATTQNAPCKPDESTFTSSNSSVSNVGVYAGSVIGGVLFLGAGIGFMMYKLRKKRIIR
jgi:hypothetical protein